MWGISMIQLRWLLILGVAGVLLVVLGIVLLKRGRSRRRGTDPHCVKCDYNLTGLQSGVCPECGTPLTERTVAIGERRGGPLRAAGALLLVVGIISILPLMREGWRRIDLTPFKPDFLLMRHAEASPGYREINELLRRDAAGGLSEAHRDRLRTLALRVQSWGFSSGSLTDWMARQHADGLLTAQQKQRFFSQLLAMKLSVEPQVAAGGYLPVQLRRDMHLPSNWWIDLSAGTASIDGLPVGLISGAVAVQGHSTTQGRTLNMISPAAGAHKLEASWRMRLMEGPFGDPASKLILEEDRTETAHFKVIANSLVPVGGVAMISQPTAAVSLIQSRIRPERFVIGAGSLNHLGGDLVVWRGTAQPTAFDVWARIGANEYRIGAVVPKSSGGNRVEHWVSGEIPPGLAPSTIDLILRSSEPAARSTPNLTQIWEGELIYRDVPVKIMPTTQP